MTIFISSDIHFFHKNLMKYCPETRAYSSVEEMNECIIENWNKKVSIEDEVYILGDISFGKPIETCQILERLNGKLKLILGNHDTSKYLKEDRFRYRFEWLKDYNEVKLFGKHIVMFHFPIEQWNRKHYGAYHFHGHLHSKNPEELNSRKYDVGLDSTFDFSPYNLEELLIDIENRLVSEERVCHHGRNL